MPNDISCFLSFPSLWMTLSGEAVEYLLKLEFSYFSELVNYGFYKFFLKT